jgi:sugar phosphate isomerase/epimerase
MPTRRVFNKCLLSLPIAMAFPGARSLFAAPFREVRFSGVRTGIQTYSFKEISNAPGANSVSTIIRDMQEVGLTECELLWTQIEPPDAVELGWWVEDRILPGYKEARERARQWRLTVPLSYYTNIRRQFESAGMQIYAYNINFDDTFTDAEREKTWQAAQALGAKGCVSSCTLSEAARLVPFVAKFNMFMAMHNHNNLIDPDQFATPASLEKAFAMSPHFYSCLDIGHFVAANFDPVSFIDKHHDRITHVHLRDRQRDNGPSLPWGKGDTPIPAVLRRIRDRKFPIRGYIEFEYGTMKPSIDEVKACVQYCKDALAG